MTLRIQLLGQPSITRDDRKVDLPGNRPLALLAYLILTRKVYHRQHLIDLLFDGPDDPRASLRWTLSKLRTAIGSEYILSEGQLVSFNFEGDTWLDVFAFEGGESDRYSGDLLEGFYLRDAPRFEEWLHFERQRLRDAYQANLLTQLNACQNQGDSAAVVIIAQQLLKLDFLNEDWQAALIESYARLGKRTTAVEQYEKYSQALHREWQTEPGPGIIALVETIQRGNLKDTPSPTASENLAMNTSIDINEPLGEPAIRTQTPARLKPARLALLALTSLSLIIVITLLWRMLSDNGRQVSLAQGSFIRDSLAQPLTDQPSLTGRKVWILGPFYDAQARLFEQSMIPFETKSGIDVVFLTGGKPYEAYLETRLEMQELPDIVVFPQPSWLTKLSAGGKIVDLRTFLDEEYLKEQFPETFLSLATVEGKLLGIWHTVGLKSLVWYPRQAVESRGYRVPETWDELIALSDQIVADGGTPWCIGIDDLEAKGWVGTDWVEDILLRTAPPEVYDAWVKHELAFDSPEIRRVFEMIGEIWFNEAYVYGGRAQISRESFFESPAHLFENPPGCYLHKQATFAPYLFPPGVVFGEDYDFFYLPPIDPQFGSPVLGSGELFAMFNDRPEVREVMRYLTTAESRKTIIQNGNFLSPHRDTPLEWFPSPADLRFAQIVLSANTYRFDGSDMMPVEVGLGSFFHGITAWVEGEELQKVLQDIDNSWPVVP